MCDSDEVMIATVPCSSSQGCLWMRMQAFQAAAPLVRQRAACMHGAKVIRRAAWTVDRLCELLDCVHV